jgi:hypothetical protein
MMVIMDQVGTADEIRTRERLHLIRFHRVLVLHAN